MINKEAKMGFTLIELLVVVLIIGILASVALPQYQRAVNKSRVANILSVLKSIYAAGQVAELTNTYAVNSGYMNVPLSDLDIEVPSLSLMGIGDCSTQYMGTNRSTPSAVIQTLAMTYCSTFGAGKTLWFAYTNEGIFYCAGTAGLCAEYGFSKDSGKTAASFGGMPPGTPYTM